MTSEKRIKAHALKAFMHKNQDICATQAEKALRSPGVFHPRTPADGPTTTLDSFVVANLPGKTRKRLIKEWNQLSKREIEKYMAFARRDLKQLDRASKKLSENNLLRNRLGKKNNEKQPLVRVTRATAIRHQQQQKQQPSTSKAAQPKNSKTKRVANKSSLRCPTPLISVSPDRSLTPQCTPPRRIVFSPIRFPSPSPVPSRVTIFRQNQTELSSLSSNSSSYFSHQEDSNNSSDETAELMSFSPRQQQIRNYQELLNRPNISSSSERNREEEIEVSLNENERVNSSVRSPRPDRNSDENFETPLNEDEMMNHSNPQPSRNSDENVEIPLNETDTWTISPEMWKSHYDVMKKLLEQIQAHMMKIMEKTVTPDDGLKMICELKKIHDEKNIFESTRNIPEVPVVKGYKCLCCERVMSRKLDMEEHVICTHLKKKDYECQFCAKFYATDSSLFEHIRDAHNSLMQGIDKVQMRKDARLKAKQIRASRGTLQSQVDSLRNQQN